MYQHRSNRMCVTRPASKALASPCSRLMVPVCAFVFLMATLFPLNAWSSDPAPPFNPELAEALETALQANLEKNKVVGAVLAVRSPDNATWKGAAGYARLESKTEMTPDLHFRIGSITKTFTSTVILKLVDQGKIKLETTVNALLPELKIVMGDVITVRNLLEMRSGLAKYLGDPSFMPFLQNDPGRIWTPEEIVEYCNQKVSDPGTTFLYTNGNYYLLGLIIEKMTGKTYTEALQEHIFGPLGLTNTSVPETLNLPEPYAAGYQYGTGLSLQKVHMTVNKTYYINPRTAWASGAVVSTAPDLLTWSKAYFDGALISEEMHREQFSLLPVTHGENPFIDAYGLGALRNGILTGHEGEIPPYGGWLAMYKDYEFVLLYNGTTKGAEAPDTASALLKQVITDVFNLL